MIDNILLVILSFLLLFLAFNSDYLSNSDTFVFDVSDGYRQFFFVEPYGSYSKSDLWLNDNGELYYCELGMFDTFRQSDWRKLVQEEIDSIPVYDAIFYNYEVEPYFDFRSQADGKIEFWYQILDPAENWSSISDIALHDGDYWYDSLNDVCYQWFEDHWGDTGTENVLAEPKRISFDTAFDFGYELTIGSLQVLTSIFKGPDAFFTRFDQWRATIFGDVTLFGFLTAAVERSVDFLDSVASKIPVVREINTVLDDVFMPFRRIIQDLVEWLDDKIG